MSVKKAQRPSVLCRPCRVMAAAGFIPKAVDRGTLNTQVGLSYVEDLWLVDVAYRGSFFRNDMSALSTMAMLQIRMRTNFLTNLTTIFISWLCPVIIA
ncbi:MtrB/PioB family outer membrane beta-barrel protein [Vibrio sp. M60_M31a]